MRKIKLDIETLSVDSFATGDDREGGRGTVRGNMPPTWWQCDTTARSQGFPDICAQESLSGQWACVCNTGGHLAETCYETCPTALDCA